MCVILTLSEVLSAKVSNKQMNDLGDWHRVFSGRRLGLFFKVFVPLIYYTFLFFIVSIFASEAFLSILGVGHGDTHIYIVFIVSFVFMLIISCIHVFSEKFGVAFGKYGTFIKYVPILFLILIAVLASIVAPDKSYFASSATESREFSFTGMLSSLPAILFAFDGFMVVGSVSKRIKNSSKSLPIILSVGILIVGLTYLTITICQLISGSATIIEAFNNLFPEEFHGSLERIFGVFLFIAAISSLNAIGLGSVNYLENIIDDNLLVGSVLVRKITKCKKNMSGVVAT
jgi:amino acid transporter